MYKRQITASAANLTATSGTVGLAGDPLETTLSSVTVSGSNGITIANTGNVTATLTANNGIATLTNDGTLVTGGTWTANEFDIDATSDITIAHGVTSDDGGDATSGVSLTSSAGTLAINAALVTTEGAAAGTKGGDVVLTAANGITSSSSGSVTTTSLVAGVTSGVVDIDVTAAGNVNLAGSITTTGAGTSGAAGQVNIDTYDGSICLLYTSPSPRD